MHYFLRTKRLRRRREVIFFVLGILILFLLFHVYAYRKTKKAVFNIKNTNNEFENLTSSDYPNGREPANRDPDYRPSAKPALESGNLLPCKAAQIKTEFYGEPAMAGIMVSGIRFFNTGDAGCTLQGFPRVELEDPSGKKVQLQFTRTKINDFLGGKMGEKAVLTPKAELEDPDYPWGVAVFNMVYSYRNAANDTGCPALGYRKLKFKITLPDDGGIIIVDKPDENQPFIDTVCDGVEYGTFEQL